MNFTYPPEAEEFRVELRTWLERHITDEDRAAGAGGLDGNSENLDAQLRWCRKLADARYAAIGWPSQYGGRDAGVMEQAVYVEEMHRAGAPGHVNALGIPNVGPSIIQWGTEEQKSYFLPRILSGEDIWCQGMSEPNAGSDLASLRMSAVLDGDTYVVNGQKIWNSLGNIATWCYLLVRTDSLAPKHRGISCLLVNMATPGIDVRRIVTITGQPGFNELFFTDVRVPAASLLGPLHRGWDVAMTTLSFERAGIVRQRIGLSTQVESLIDLAHRTPYDGATAADSPVIRTQLAKVYAKAEAFKLLGDRMLSAMASGRTPGPEGSLAITIMTETSKEIADLRTEIAGPDGIIGEIGLAHAGARASGIAGGTTQVNKNVVAQRVLGLPRDR
jgi:alkylation response protein AidB-like acyl-CoA dehydrogenase